MSNTILSGSLAAIPLADILMLLNNGGKTGTLRCSCAGTSKMLEWEAGEIVFARSTLQEDRLGAYLLARGKVTQEQLRQATKSAASQERMGKTLVRQGVLTPSALWEAVQGQVTEIVYSLFQWKEGTFEFSEGSPPKEKIALEISVMNLILEAARRLDEWSLVREKIHSDGVILAALKTVEEASQAAKLSDVERNVMALIDGRRTVGEVAELAGTGQFEAWQALYALLSAGLLRVQLLAFDPPQAPTPATNDDAALDATLDRYGRAVEEMLGRAEQAGGVEEVSRVRRRLRGATFAQAHLLRDVAIEPDGRMNRRVLLANVAEDSPAQRVDNLRAALDGLVKLVSDALQGKVQLDDVLADLNAGDRTGS